MKKQVENFDAFMLNLKSEILKLTMVEKGKSKMSDEHQKVGTKLKECKLSSSVKKKRSKN